MAETKQVIVVRKDLKMPRGKIAAQASHASVGALLQSMFGKRLEESDFDGFQINKTPIVNDATKDWLLESLQRFVYMLNQNKN